MARRKKYDDEITKNSGSVGYSQAALEKLNAGTYGRDIGSKRQVQYRTSQEQTQQSRQLPVLEGLTRSNDWESSFGHDKLNRAAQYQQNLANDAAKYTYNESLAKANTLDKKDQGYLQRLIDNFGDGDVTRDALKTSTHTKDWEKKYGKTYDEIYRDFLADQGNAKMRQGQAHPILSEISTALGSLNTPLTTIPSLIANAIAPNSKAANALEDTRSRYENQRKLLRAGVKERTGDKGDKIIDTVNAVADRMIPTIAGNAIGGNVLGGVLAGASDANRRMDELNLRPDLDNRSKALTALGQGAVEGVGTAITSGLLDKIPSVGGIGGRLLNVGKGAGNATIENSISEAIEMGLDTAINRENSAKELNKAAYMLNGMSEEDATAQARKDQLGQVGSAALTGALFGGGMKGLSEIGDAIKGLSRLKSNAEITQPDVIKAAQAQQAQAVDNINRLSEQIPDITPSIHNVDGQLLDTVKVPEYTADSNVFFEGTDADISLAEAQDKAITDTFKNIVSDPEFNALSFKNGKQKIYVSPSTSGNGYRMSYTIDGVPTGHHDYSVGEMDALSQNLRELAGNGGEDIRIQRKSDISRTQGTAPVENTPNTPKDMPETKGLVGDDLKAAQDRVTSNKSKIKALENEIKVIESDFNNKYRGNLKKSAKADIESRKAQIAELKQDNKVTTRQIKGEPTPVIEQLDADSVTRINDFKKEVRKIGNMWGGESGKQLAKDVNDALDRYIESGSQEDFNTFARDLWQLHSSANGEYTSKAGNVSRYSDYYGDIEDGIFGSAIRDNGMLPNKAIRDIHNARTMNESVGGNPTLTSEVPPTNPPMPSDEGNVPPKTDISRRYETLKKSDLFTKSEANMKMLESAKEKGVFNKDVEARKVAQDEALQEYLNDKDTVIAKNLDKAWDSGKDVDTSMLILQDALDSGDNALTNLTLSKQVTKGKEAGRQLRAMRDYAYAGTKEGTITKAAEFLNDKADEVLSSQKTAEQFNAIAERILNGDLSDLDKRFNMDDINIQNIKDALDAGAGKADIAKMIAMYQSVGKTGISPEAIQQINDIYNQIEQGNFNPNSKARADLEADAFKVLANDIGGKRSWKEMWDSWRYLAMLGNPKTHLRNVLGNATHYMVTEAKDNIGAVIEGVVDKASRNGIERTKAVLSPTDRELVNVAAKDADDVAYASLADAKNKYDVKDEIGRARDSFNNKVLTKIDDLNSNALDLEDYSALKRKYSKSLARFLKANGADESIFNATDDASKALLDKGRAYAIDQAKQATFHEYSKMAQTLNQLSKNLSEGNAASKAGGMILEGLLPFKKTPINILKQGIKYSPVSLAKAIGTTLNAVKTGNKSASDAIEDLASGLTGTGIMAMGALLANQGLLTGGANENYDVDTAETEQGAQNYALKIGNNSYTLDWLAPMSLPLFVGAELMNKYSGDSNDEEGVFDRVISALSTIGEPITEMSMLQGIQNILNELSYSTENVLATFGTNATLGYASQAIPTLAGQFARAIDDTRRSTYTDKPAGFKRQFDKTLTKVENKIPFLSMTNEPYVNASGNTQQNEGLITSIFGNGFLPRLGDQMLSPGYYKQGNVTPVDEELNRLYEATGENVYKNVSSGKVNNEKLSKEKFTDYQKLYGSNTDTFYNGLVSSENYKNLDDAARVKALSEAKSISKMIADYEVGGKALKDSEQKVYDIYKSQGADGIVQYINDKQAAKSLDMSYETYVKKEAEQPGGAQAYVQEKQAAVDSGFVNKSGNADVKGYEKAMSQAGAQSQKFVNDLPMLQQTGLEKSAYYTYANAINVIPSLTPSEFAQTYNEINTNTSNAMTQKELLDYLNKYQFSDDPAEDERIANELWRAYGGWKNKAGVEKKIKLQNGQWKSYY